MAGNIEEDVPSFAKVRNGVRIFYKKDGDESAIKKIVRDVLMEKFHIRKEEIVAMMDYPRKDYYDVIFKGEGIYKDFLVAWRKAKNDPALFGMRMVPHFDNEVIVTVKSFSPYLPLEDIMFFLKTFCLKLTFLNRINNEEGIWTCKYKFLMIFKEGTKPPARFRIGSINVELFYQGMDSFCRKCKNYGHEKESCTEVKTQSEILCNLCGENNHRYANCPNRKKKEPVIPAEESKKTEKVVEKVDEEEDESEEESSEASVADIDENPILWSEEMELEEGKEVEKDIKSKLLQKEKKLLSAVKEKLTSSLESESQEQFHGESVPVSQDAGPSVLRKTKIAPVEVEKEKAKIQRVERPSKQECERLVDLFFVKNVAEFDKRNVDKKAWDEVIENLIPSKGFSHLCKVFNVPSFVMVVYEGMTDMRVLEKDVRVRKAIPNWMMNENPRLASTWFDSTRRYLMMKKNQK